jgi:hypothetical protein
MLHSVFEHSTAVSCIAVQHSIALDLHLRLLVRYARHSCFLPLMKRLLLTLLLLLLRTLNAALAGALSTDERSAYLHSESSGYRCSEPVHLFQVASVAS